MVFVFSSRSRHTRCSRDWSSDVCSSDLGTLPTAICPPASQTAETPLSRAPVAASNRYHPKPEERSRSIRSSSNTRASPRARSSRPPLREIRRRSEEHTSELQSRLHLVCRLLLEKKKTPNYSDSIRYPTATALPHT